jgi:hypothetical protein
MWGLASDIALAWEENRANDAEFLQATFDACARIRDLRERWSQTPLLMQFKLTENAAQLKERADILRVIETYTVNPLRKAGNQWKVICPFHNDRTPSLSVTPEKGLWRCFGCGEGGDVYDFVRKLYPVKSFRETMEMVAIGAGIDPGPYLAAQPTKPSAQPTPIGDKRKQPQRLEFVGGRVVAR